MDLHQTTACLGAQKTILKNSAQTLHSYFFFSVSFYLSHRSLIQRVDKNSGRIWL